MAPNGAGIPSRADQKRKKIMATQQLVFKVPGREITIDVVTINGEMVADRDKNNQFLKECDDLIKVPKYFDWNAQQEQFTARPYDQLPTIYVIPKQGDTDAWKFLMLLKFLDERAKGIKLAEGVNFSHLLQQHYNCQCIYPDYEGRTLPERTLEWLCAVND